MQPELNGDTSELRPEGLRDVPTFARLGHEQFEELVLDWIRAEYPGADAHRFGPGPLSQQGYDIEATLSNGVRICCECKGRKDTFGRKQLVRATEKFLKGTKADWTNEFWIVTSGLNSRTSGKAVLDAKLACEARGKTFTYVWREKLWSRVKNHPEVVRTYLGKDWWEISLAWCHARFLQSREEARRKQGFTTFSSESEEIYDDGYLRLTLRLPNATKLETSAGVIVKTDGLERALITLSNDNVLDAFNESLWPDSKPLLATEFMGQGWAQIGNVRVRLNHDVFAKLACNLRSARNRWTDRISTLERELEAAGFQFLSDSYVKLGQIKVGMWREMISFASEHDARNGQSQWHIFDPSAIDVKVFTDTETAEMDRGYHLRLTTRQRLTDSTPDGENLDLVWCPLPSVIDGEPARGTRRAWGCETAVDWLKEELIPHLIDLHWTTSAPGGWIVRLLRRLPPRDRRRPEVNFCMSSEPSTGQLQKSEIGNRFMRC